MGERSRSATLAWVAVWGGAALLVAATVFTTRWPDGAAVVRKYMLSTHPLASGFVILFWLIGGCAALALVAAFAASPNKRPRRSRVVFGAVAAATILAGLYALRVFHDANSSITSLKTFVLGTNFFVDGPSWLGWMGLLVWGGFAIAAVLVVAAILVPRAAPDPGSPAGISACAEAEDDGARRLAFWASTSILAVVTITALRIPLWSLTFVRSLAHGAFGNHVWLATVALALALAVWLAPSIVIAWRARAPRAAWAVWAAASSCGVLFSAKAFFAGLTHWEPSKGLMQAAFDPFVSSDGAAAAQHRIEVLRQGALEYTITAAVLLGLALILGVATVRQYRAWRTASPQGRVGGRPAAAASLWGRGPALIAVVAVGVTVLAPVISSGVVGDGGSLLGLGRFSRPSFASTPASTATSPTPIPSPSGSAGAAGPDVLGVVPGKAQAADAAPGWSGDTVQLNLNLHGERLEAGRCQLFVNDKLQALANPPQLAYLSAQIPTLMFNWQKPYGPGDYHFRVVLVAGGGGSSQWGWSYSSH